MNQIETMAATFLALICISLPATAENANYAMLAWMEAAKNDHKLYFSERMERLWSKPEMILNSRAPIISPAISSDNKNTWIAFIELNGATGRIKVLRSTGKKWQKQPDIVSDTQNDWGPSIILDSNGNPWLAWVGFDGTDDDIYYTYWTGNKWKKTLRVNTDDGWPDTLPILYLNKDRIPEVRWSGFNGSKYIQYTSSWNGASWSAERVAINPFSGPASLQTELPAFLTERTQAALHLRNRTGIQSSRVISNLHK